MVLTGWHRWVGVVVAAVALAAGAGLVSAHATARANRALARGDTARLLKRFPLPPGAVRSATEPSGDHKALARPAARQITPNLVARHEWWIVPGARSTVWSYVNAHLPTGVRQVASGHRGLHGPTTFVAYAWPALRGKLSERWVVLSVATLPGRRTGLRVEAQDVWITPRPASETIPPGSTSLVVAVLRGGHRVRGPFTFSAARQLGGARALINSLPVWQPGGYACPADFGVDVRFVFNRTGLNPPIAVVNMDPGGCGVVQLRLRGRAELPLSSYLSTKRSLVQRLGSALGLHLAQMVARVSGY